VKSENEKMKFEIEETEITDKEIWENLYGKNTTPINWRIEESTDIIDLIRGF